MRSSRGHERIAVTWTDIGPREHFCQFYQNDALLLDTVNGFIAPGLKTGDAAVIIATQSHLRGLESRLNAGGVDIAAAIASNQYIPLDAAETLSKFMDGGWPGRVRFFEEMRTVLSLASKNGRRVRAFGEMVALLWSQGNRPATIRLERLWNELAMTDSFSLFCAYPKHFFSTTACGDSIIDICSAHSHIIPAAPEFETNESRIQALKIS